MSPVTTLSNRAVELFEQQWCERFSQERITIGKINCPLNWLMPELLRLAQEFDAQTPFDDMRPVVRRLVVEFDFANQTAVHDETEELIDAYVDTLVEVLDRVRCDARDQGQWTSSIAPAMPPLAG